MRAFFMFYLLLSGAPVAAQHATNGWVELPKTAVVEEYTRRGDRVEKRIQRSYHYSDQRLDSIVDLEDDHRHVYTGFTTAQTIYNIVPWDRSIYATTRNSWKKEQDGKWYLVARLHDSIDTRHHRFTTRTITTRDSLGKWSIGYLQTRIYDKEGIEISSSVQYDNGALSTTTTQVFRDSRGRVTRLLRIELSTFSKAGDLDTSENTVYRYNAEDVYPSRMEYFVWGSRNSENELFAVEPTKWTDTVAEFSRSNFTFSGIWHDAAGRMTLEGIEIGRYADPLRFASVLDERYRLIRSNYGDSTVTTASYYDDNYVKLAETRIDGKLFKAERNIRTLDKKGRVLTQERQEHLSFREKVDEDYRTKQRITFSY